MCDLWYRMTIWCIYVMVLAIVTEAITEIAVASMLTDPIRKCLGRRALPEDPARLRWYWQYPYKLATCGWCMSVWIAGILMLMVPVAVVVPPFCDNFIVKVFLVQRLSNVVHILYELARRGRVATHDVMVTYREELKHG